MFAVISFTDDSLEPYDVNADALNHPIAKQKLVKSNIKSVVVIYSIKNDKPKKMFVFQKCQCFHLFDQGPVLGMCINYEIQSTVEPTHGKMNVDASSNVLNPNKALLFFSWKTQKPVTSPMEAPDQLLWSKDSKYCVMRFNFSTVKIYSLSENLELMRSYNIAANQCNIIGEFLLIITDECVYATILDMPSAPLYQLANIEQIEIHKESSPPQGETKEEEEKQQIENPEWQASRPPFALQVLDICKNNLILLLYNGDLKCLEIKSFTFSFAQLVKGSEEDRLNAKRILESRKDLQNELLPIAVWGGLSHLIDYNEILVPTEVNQYNFKQCLLTKKPIEVIHSIIINTSLEKLDKYQILEAIFETLTEMEDYQGAMVAAMGTGNKELVSQALQQQKRYDEAKALLEASKADEKVGTANQFLE